MKYGLSLVTAPTVEPISLAEARKQVELPEDDTHHTDHLLRLITTARRVVEKRTNRQLITATWDLKLDRFPLWSGDSQNQPTPQPINIPLAPLQSVSYIHYTDTSDVTQTLSTNVYKVITTREPAQIWLKFGQIWPIARFEPDVVTVRFVAGYGDTGAVVPQEFKQMMLLAIGEWFEDRIAEGEVSPALESLLTLGGYGDEFTEYGVDFYAAR